MNKKNIIIILCSILICIGSIGFLLITKQSKDEKLLFNYIHKYLEYVKNGDIDGIYKNLVFSNEEKKQFTYESAQAIAGQIILENYKILSLKKLNDDIYQFDISYKIKSEKEYINFKPFLFIENDIVYMARQFEDLPEKYSNNIDYNKDTNTNTVNFGDVIKDNEKEIIREAN